MQVSNFSSREFNQHVAAAKKAANGDDIVYILDRGKPAHVLMSIEKFRELSGQKQSILQMLAMPEAADIDFDVKPISDLPRSVDLS
ncbi:type II toxin-antitoxin system Phd/YefM family antitoxin [Ochrobactrum sp. Marseille-Q0166]|uniref:type II toxin-antitoxin system Phd/YefM family antitoxin n=1 Tax=Ochrobactrum sp. Marseille-Q0166 TaxID=2761105 RepID=UPI00165587F6|nr:type II toxin-antitoxin system Phd/YefM family antitoxin [Ochrobactrum sp. Marseille-Q0166]MBC8719804.1 type II toxin-antitoxin system Phd/YefM family antitoxin [Ochrobactrum sp. Marseille-Q0166]